MSFYSASRLKASPENFSAEIQALKNEIAGIHRQLTIIIKVILGLGVRQGKPRLEIRISAELIDRLCRELLESEGRREITE